jgi:hypothetical protein
MGSEWLAVAFGLGAAFAWGAGDFTGAGDTHRSAITAQKPMNGSTMKDTTFA